MDEIQKADPRARKTAGWILAGIAGLALVGLFALAPTGPEIAERVANYLIGAQGQPARVIVPGLLLIAPLLLVAGWLYRYGGQVVRAGRLPLPTEKVIRDTVVHTGAAARWRGQMIRGLALLLFVASGCLPFAVNALVQSLPK